MTKVVNKNYEKYDVYIGRGSLFGNPFRINYDGTRAEVINLFEKYFLDKIETEVEFKRQVLSLKDKTLGCFCKPKACHGDVIVDWIINYERSKKRSTST